MKIVALDPGGTTGVALMSCRSSIETDEDFSLTTFQLGPEDHHGQLWGFLSMNMPDVVICESFLHRQMAKVNLMPVQYIGVIKLWCHTAEKELVFQTPSYGKAFWSDQKLKRVDTYYKGQGHANDAMRHLLMYMQETQKQLYFLRKL